MSLKGNGCRERSDGAAGAVEVSVRFPSFLRSVDDISWLTKFACYLSCNRDEVIAGVEESLQQGKTIPSGSFGGFSAQEIRDCYLEATRLHAKFTSQRQNVVNKMGEMDKTYVDYGRERSIYGTKFG